MSFISDLFSGGASKLVDSVGNTLDKVITTKSEKMQFDNEIKKAAMNHRLEMQKLSVEERKLMYDDLSSARTRETTVQQSPHASKLGKNISSYLAIAATILCFTLFYILVFQPGAIGNEQSKDIVIYILGVLSALLTQVYSYYFGSSSGSADKTRVLENHLNQQDNL